MVRYGRAIRVDNRVMALWPVPYYVCLLGKGVKSWKKRWFVLKPNGFLYYYTGPDCKTEKGRVDIVNATRVAMYNEVSTAEKLSSSSQSTRTFAVATLDRTYTCVCDSTEECRWVRRRVTSIHCFMYYINCVLSKSYNVILALDYWNRKLIVQGTHIYIYMYRAVTKLLLYIWWTITWQSITTANVQLIFCYQNSCHSSWFL